MKFWTIVKIILIAVIAIKILSAIHDAQEAKRAKINGFIKKMQEHEAALPGLSKSVDSCIQQFFKGSGRSYEDAMHEIYGTVNRMQEHIYEMRSINRDLVRVSAKEDQNDAISRIEAKYMPQVKKKYNDFVDFSAKVLVMLKSYMIDEKSYGKIQKAYWDSVCAMDRSTAVAYISKCESLLGTDAFDEIFAIDVEKIMACIWFFATEKTYSASDFQKAQDVFKTVRRLFHPDVIIADLYAKKKMGGEDALRDPVRALVNGQYSADTLTLFASSLMWMNAYKQENTILQHMLASGKQMPAKTQERLHALSNGSGKAPDGFDVQSSSDTIYFDVSSLAWRDDEYNGLFENLAFQDKNLSYSLAIRDENKDLFIPQGIQIPDENGILEKFRSTFADEYGSGVAARSVNCVAMSGSGEEKMRGILVSTEACRQLGVLIHIAKIGKKLIIKFYTMFMPEGADLAAQKQQALSMSKKLSPIVSMWESSLKDTMLMAVEQLLNTASQNTPGTSNTSNTSGTSGNTGTSGIGVTETEVMF